MPWPWSLFAAVGQVAGCQKIARGENQAFFRFGRFTVHIRQALELIGGLLAVADALQTLGLVHLLFRRGFHRLRTARPFAFVGPIGQIVVGLGSRGSLCHTPAQRRERQHQNQAKPS